MDVLTMAAEGSLVDPKILLIESDVPTVRALVAGLEQANMQVVWARDSTTGLALSARLQPDIVLVGLGLTDVDSVVLVGHLVEPRNCGVIVLAGAENEAARIASLELGADDYLAKPPTVRDMIARVRAVHRRVNVRKHLSVVPSAEAVLAIGPIRINLQNRSVHTPEGRRINLTSAEYTALETFARAGGNAVSRDSLSAAALRRPWRPEDRSVDQLVFNLRQKLPLDADGGVLIQSIRGSGYWMRAPDRQAQQRPDFIRPEFAWPAEDAGIPSVPNYQLAQSA